MSDSLESIVAAMTPTEKLQAQVAFTGAYENVLTQEASIQKQISQIYNSQKTSTKTYDESLAGLTGVRAVVPDSVNTGSKTMEKALEQLKATGNRANNALDALGDSACDCKIGNMSETVGNKKMVAKTLTALGIDPSTIAKPTIPAKDTTPPAVPTSIVSAGGASDSGIPLVLTNSTSDNFVANIIRIRPVTLPAAEWTLAGVTGQNSFTIPDDLTEHYEVHEVKVTAANKDGVESTAATTTVTPGDPGSPLELTGLVVGVADGGFSASWTHSASPDVANYVLYTDTSPSFPAPQETDLGYVNTYTEDRLTNGTAYYLKIKTVDRDDNVSTGVTYGPFTPSKVTFSHVVVKSAPVGPEVGPWVLAITTNASRPIQLGSLTGTCDVTLGAVTRVTGSYFADWMAADININGPHYFVDDVVDSNHLTLTTPEGPATAVSFVGYSTVMGPSTVVTFSNPANPPTVTVAPPDGYLPTPPVYTRVTPSQFTVRIDGVTLLGTATFATTGIGENGDETPSPTPTQVVDLTLL